MRKTNKNLTKQILTLMLAFVMVFTGMGIGSWGVDTAWANEIAINLEAAGVSTYDYARDINISIAERPINKLYVKTVDDKNSFKIKQTIGQNSIFIYTAAGAIGFEGMGWTKKRSVTPSKDHGYITDIETLKKAGLATVDFDTDCKQYYFLAPIAQGYAFLLQVKTISYDTNKTELNNWIAKVTGENASNWYQSEDTYNGKTESSQGFWTELQSVLSEAQTISADSSYDQTAVDTATSKLKAKVENLISRKYVNASGLYENVKAARTKQEIGYTAASWGIFKTAWNQAEQLLSALYNEDGTPKSANRGPNAEDEATAESIEQAKVDEITTALANAINNLMADKTKLEEAIAKVTGANAAKWHQENDKYNGKELSQNGFWSAMQEKLTLAEQIRNKEGATGEEIATATSNLQSAIANLIPKTQLNATNLYETVELMKKRTRGDFLESFTQATAKNFKAVLADAEKYLALLFNGEKTEENPNGANQKENVPANQGKADGYAEALNTAWSGLVHVDVFAKAQDDASLIQALAKRFSMTENNGKYTDESWNAFTSAREKALAYAAAHPLTKDSTYSEVVGYERHRKAFSQAAYGLISKTENNRISVSLVFTDDYLLRNPSARWNYSEVSPGSKTYTLTEEEGYTIKALFAKAGINRASYIYSQAIESEWAIMINDEAPADFEKVIRLKDGDVVHFIHRYRALYEPVYGLEPAPSHLTVDYLGALRFAETGTQVAKAGKAFSLHVERTSAALEKYTGIYEAFEGAELAAYGPQKEDGSYPEKPIWTGSLSDASGKASLKLYETGTYLLTAFDPRENDNEEHIYPSLNAAAPYITVCVEEAEDSSAVKAELKKELDKVYNDCKSLDLNYDGTKVDENGKPEPEYFTKEEKSQIDKAYEDAVKVLRNSKSTAADSYKAQQEAIKAIQQIQKTTTEAYDKSLAAFRKNLNKLPDDTKLITKSVESIVESLIQTHNSMTAYAKEKLLTKVEKEKYNQIAALQGKLPEAKKYTLRYAVTADTDEAKTEIEKVMKYLHDNPAMMDRYEGGGYDHEHASPIKTPYSFYLQNEIFDYDEMKEFQADPQSKIRFTGDLTYNAYFQTRNVNVNEGKSFQVPNTKASLTDENIFFSNNGKTLVYDVEGTLTLKIDGVSYELKSITYDGLEKADVTNKVKISYDDSGYKGKNPQWVNLYFNQAYLDFTMPYNDVTITLNWAPVTSNTDLENAKTQAKQVLDEAFAKYKENEDSYSKDNWSKLEEAYSDGITAIGAATTIDDVTKARKDAVTAMSKVTKVGQTAPSPEAVGSVRVIVENTTFTKDKWKEKTFWEGTLVDTDVEITKNSTMMGCVVEALKTVDATQKGAQTNYISSITDKNGNELGEFDGGSSSGWMGTLNDWFNNEGFGNFTVANGALGDGDEIRIMYTTKGYGEDLGGSWANSNTTLKDLSVSGGTLTPSFTSGTSGNSYDYTLLISGKTANIKVTPTAANKNFLTKIFLNEKVTSNVQGSSFYKRTQYIPVTAGDTIYVGCGERRWPSMNNQEGNTQANGGTWYALKVVNSSNAKDTIEKAIAELPDADKIKIGNYKNTKDAAKDIRDLYNSLTSTVQNTIDKDKLDKLKAVEEKVKFYSEIDDAKDKLNALTDSSSSSQAREALSAYEKLTKEQKEYITEADAAKFNELAKKYNLSTITGSAEMPESPVETTGKAGSAVTTSPAEVKVSGTTGAVTVKADNQKEILKQAKEKKSAQVVLAIANSDAKGAEKLELNLDKSFLESLLKDTSAKLVVKTPLGQKTYERDELQKLVNETTGTTVKAEINKDNVDTAAEEPTEENAAKIEKAKSIVKNMKLVARSSKTAKKNIKAVLKSDAKVNASIKELKDLGFTVKYRFYRSTKKAASYKAAVTKKTAAYTNTSGKKGTKYFYKVQVRVYDENGKLVAKTALKQCKYASRVWSK